MPELLEKTLGFALILLLPLVIIGGALVTLFAVGALFDALENPAEVSRMIEAAFRRPPRAARATAADHYYQPYWQPPKPKTP
jgi:hypothetical protein